VRRDPVAANLQGPFCECGECDATGHGGGPEIRLPPAAWAVAGHGDLEALAIRPDHSEPYERSCFVLEHHDGWIAVRPA
jgi:hypothetical protein